MIQINNKEGNYVADLIEEKSPKNVLKENLSVLATPAGFQQYILGTKKNGSPRAVYDVFKDYTKPKKKKKKKKNHHNDPSLYGFYTGGHKKKKKKKKNKKKYWHI